MARVKKEYSVKRLTPAGTKGERARTEAQVVRNSDGKEMLTGWVQLSVAKSYCSDMNDKTGMGPYLIGKAA